MVRIVGLKYVLALAAPVVIAAGTVVYAAQEQRFDLPINATVTLVQQSGTEAADLNVDGRVDARDLLIITRSESEYCLTGAAGKPRSLGVNHSCRSSMVSHRCSLNPVTFSTGLGTLGTCG